MPLAAAAVTPLDLAGAVLEVVDALTMAGISAVVDQRDLNPPGVLVSAPTITFNRLRGWTATLDLYAVVPSAGRAQSLAALGPLVDQVTAIWPATYGYPVDLPNLDGGDPLPAYRLPIPIRVC